jgi:hypothetical protein
MNGRDHNTYRRLQKQQELFQRRAQKFAVLRALLAEHESAKEPDIEYIRDLKHRFDVLRRRMMGNGDL